MKMASPLNRARGLGSAKDGVHHWWVQRVTAVALVPLVLWFVIAVISASGMSHAEFRLWVGSPFNAVLLVLLIVATFHHAQLGLQVVIEDYIQGEGAKIALVLAAKGLAVLFGALGVFAVLKVALRG
jgi:succinate dehydrogenase / fumarate reductase, membrane anchor subunit